MNDSTNAQPVTSGSVARVADVLRSGRHPLMIGAVDDDVLMEGRPMSLSQAVLELGRSSFDIVLHLDMADGLRVVHGEEAYKELLDGDPVNDERAGEAGGCDLLPERERRLADLAAWRPEPADDLSLTMLRRCLAQSRRSVFVLFEQVGMALHDPDQHAEPDRQRVAIVHRALQEASTGGPYRNTCVLSAGAGSTFPPLLQTSDEVGLVTLAAPTRRERRALINHLDSDGEIPQDDVREIVALTDGETLATVGSLYRYRQRTGRDGETPRQLLDAYRHGRTRTNPWNDLLTRISQIAGSFKQRLFGQAAAISVVVGALAAAALDFDQDAANTTSPSRPRAVLAFYGPTGVGKTYLAQLIAQEVFGDKDAMIRIDMAELREAHSLSRLTGASPGYVGYEQGGELTNAVAQRPFSVVLLDEIDKAHPAVLEQLMGMLDEGRMTDGQGRTVSFGQTLVIVTSNEGADEVEQLLAAEGPDVDYEQVRRTSIAAVERLFADRGQPHVLGRIDHVIAFDVLRPEVIDRLTERFLRDFGFRAGPTVEADLDSAKVRAKEHMRLAGNRALGGRSIRSHFAHWYQLLARWLIESDNAQAETVRIRWENAQLRAAVDEGSEVPVGSLSA